MDVKPNKQTKQKQKTKTKQKPTKKKKKQKSNSFEVKCVSKSHLKSFGYFHSRFCFILSLFLFLFLYLFHGSFYIYIFFCFHIWKGSRTRVKNFYLAASFGSTLSQYPLNFCLTNKLIKATKWKIYKSPINGHPLNSENTFLELSIKAFNLKLEKPWTALLSSYEIPPYCNHNDSN